MPLNQEDAYLNFPAAAKALTVSEVWLRRLLNAGEVPGAERVAGRVVFRKADFLPWCRAYNARPKRRARLTEK